MKKICLLLLTIACLWGCTQQNQQQAVQQLMNNIKSTMPVEIYNELNKKQIYNTIGDTYSLGNDKDEPTLRLDFTYEGDKLVQYTSKEYGFVDHEMKDHSIDEKQAVALVKQFAKIFLHKEVNPIPRAALSGYEDAPYIAYEDEQHCIYLVQLNKGMVIQYREE